MASPTQENRPGSFRVHNPNVGANDLLFERMRGIEAVSALFDFTVDLLAPKAVSFDDVLNQPATVTLSGADGPVRYFSGIVRSLEQGRRIVAAAEGGPTSLIRYRAHLVPALWRLTRRLQSRILRRDGTQSMTVVNALDQVLVKEWGLDVAFRLQDPRGLVRDRIVQYRESDFAFVSRLLEDEGLWYYFEHTEKRDGLVVTDAVPQLPPGTQTLIFNDTPEGARNQRVSRWRKRQEVRGNRVTLRDYCFQLADKDLTRPKGLGAESVTIGTASHRLAHPHAPRANQDMFETYDFPARVAQRFDGVSKNGDEMLGNPLGNVHPDLERTADLRLQEETSRGFAIHGVSNYAHLTAGFPFKLTGHFDADDSYFLTSVQHEVSQRGTYVSGAATRFRYRNRFTCLPVALAYRPRRQTRKPRIDGTQTAVVVAPEKSDAFLDKFGRVKVRFHWDRNAGSDAGASSCWVRVAQSWAGKSWGAFFWPRVGQEVVVTFEDGDPERPLITGSVYNNVNMPPVDPKTNPNLAGFKSCTMGADPGQHFNAVMFDDRPEHEQLYFHSETHEVNTTEATRFRHTTAPSIEFSGSMNIPVPGSGSGGGDFSPTKLLPYSTTAWLAYAGAGAIKMPTTAVLMAQFLGFPAKTNITCGNQADAVIFGNRKSHTTLGSDIRYMLDPYGLMIGAAFGTAYTPVTNKLVKGLQLLLRAALFANDPLGYLGAPPASGQIDMACGDKTNQAYWGTRLDVNRGDFYTYNGFKASFSDVMPNSVVSTKYLSMLIALVRVTCDTLTVVLGGPTGPSSSGGPAAAGLWFSIANGGILWRLHGVLAKFETLLARTDITRVKTTAAAEALRQAKRDEVSPRNQEVVAAKSQAAAARRAADLATKQRKDLNRSVFAKVAGYDAYLDSAAQGAESGAVRPEVVHSSVGNYTLNAKDLTITSRYVPSHSGDKARKPTTLKLESIGSPHNSDGAIDIYATELVDVNAADKARVLLGDKSLTLRFGPAPSPPAEVDPLPEIAAQVAAEAAARAQTAYTAATLNPGLGLAAVAQAKARADAAAAAAATAAAAVPPPPPPPLEEATAVFSEERIRLGVGIDSYIDIGPDRIEIKVGNMGLLINSKGKDKGVLLRSGDDTEKWHLRTDKTSITSLGTTITINGNEVVRATKLGLNV